MVKKKVSKKKVSYNNKTVVIGVIVLVILFVFAFAYQGSREDEEGLGQAEMRMLVPMYEVFDNFINNFIGEGKLPKKPKTPKKPRRPNVPPPEDPSGEKYRISTATVPEGKPKPYLPWEEITEAKHTFEWLKFAGNCPRTELVSLNGELDADKIPIEHLENLIKVCVAKAIYPCRGEKFFAGCYKTRIGYGLNLFLEYEEDNAIEKIELTLDTGNKLASIETNSIEGNIFVGGGNGADNLRIVDSQTKLEYYRLAQGFDLECNQEYVWRNREEKKYAVEYYDVRLKEVYDNDGNPYCVLGASCTVTLSCESIT